MFQFIHQNELTMTKSFHLNLSLKITVLFDYANLKQVPNYPKQKNKILEERLHCTYLIPYFYCSGSVIYHLFINF